MKIGVTSPLYVTNNNHRDFINKATQSIAMSHTFVWLPVENHVASHYKPLQYSFTQHPDEMYVIEGRQPQSVSKGWNDGVQKGIDVGCDYILIINDDIIIKRNAIDRLVAFAEAHPEFVIWSMGGTPDMFNIENCEEDEEWSEHPNFSAFMVKKDFFTHVGRFDENIIPAYYEDNDMHGRLALANKKAVIYGGARFYHFGSRTVNSDEEYRTEMPKFFRSNGEYFVRKFGRAPAGEVDEMRATYFKTPFNDPTKTLFDW